jgi:hypothetical protein
VREEGGEEGEGDRLYVHNELQDLSHPLCQEIPREVAGVVIINAVIDDYQGLDLGVIFDPPRQQRPLGLLVRGREDHKAIEPRVVNELRIQSTLLADPEVDSCGSSGVESELCGSDETLLFEILCHLKLTSIASYLLGDSTVLETERSSEEIKKGKRRVP